MRKRDRRKFGERIATGRCGLHPLAGEGSEDDDPATTALAQRLPGGLNQPSRCLDVDRKHGVDVFVICFDHCLRYHDAGIGHDSIDTTEMLIRFIGPALLRTRIICVIMGKMDLSLVTHSPLRQRRAAHTKRYRPAFAKKSSSDMVAYTPTCTGYESNAFCRSFHHASPTIWR
ncbi:hypothetical protein D3C87_1169880 [compost metagenome]